MTAHVYMKENVIHCMATVHAMQDGLVLIVKKSVKEDIMVWTARIGVDVRTAGHVIMCPEPVSVHQAGLVPSVRNLALREPMAQLAATSASARMEATVIQLQENVDVHQVGLEMCAPTRVLRVRGVIIARNCVTVIILQHVII